jgi:hypothetical protein
MTCSYVKNPTFSAIICTRGQKYPRCKFCHGERIATQLCDFEVGKTLGGEAITCDERICVFCLRRIDGGKEICPKHP